MKKLRITIGNKSYDVTVEDLTEAEAYGSPPLPSVTSSVRPAPIQPTPRIAPAGPQTPVDAGAVTSPMAGQIKSILVKQGDTVKKGQPLVVLEAMKMENQITAPIGGTVVRVDIKEGDAVQEGNVLLVLE